YLWATEIGYSKLHADIAAGGFGGVGIPGIKLYARARFDLVVWKKTYTALDAMFSYVRDFPDRNSVSTLTYKRYIKIVGTLKVTLTGQISGQMNFNAFIGRLDNDFNMKASAKLETGPTLTVKREASFDTLLLSSTYHDLELSSHFYFSSLYSLYTHSHTVSFQLVYVLSNPKDYRKEYSDSLMYKYVGLPVNWILLNITLPPGPEATPTTTNEPEGEIIMKIISMENKGKERKIQVLVDKRITLTQFKEELVPLIGVPPTGFIVYEISGNEEYEMEELDEALEYSGSKLIVRLGRPLRKGEKRIKLYLLQVNNTEFCKYMMYTIYAEGTPVREFKKQIIEEAKVQGIDCVLELDKMRLRNKREVFPGSVYFDVEWIYTSTSMEMYVEPLTGPEKKYEAQIQVYVIRWRPSQCSVDPIEEIILDKIDPKHVIGKLSELSGVPVEYISFSKGGSFPVEISCLDIEKIKLKWYSINSSKYSLGLFGDGHVIYYKDNRETMKELTDKERSEIQEAEEARSVNLMFHHDKED
ncbi:PREDICTED: ubiquitin carboxyl-terminal hydrolase 47-like, partial [Amphimedon queenslandica]|uniref:Ubiquitin carboxyl-terminal hydrolase 47 C-terminal domain-containing protein n=3 Tax=Amphimedon queenslandica TaxID=400682 RepID=A0AAN0JKD4_AMPQE